MDLSIAAKKFCAVTMTKNNQMGEYPTPPPSIGSIAGSPGSTSSRTISRGSSLDENSPSECKPITGTSQRPPQQYSEVSPIALAEILKKTLIQRRSDTKPSTMILKKIQRLKRAREVGMQESPARQTLVYRTMANYSRINENAFIRIDEEGFHEKKRLRIQIEDDLLKDENILKKFKPDDFHGLPRRLKSRENIDLMALMLKTSLESCDSLPQNDSLAWLEYIARMQGVNNGNRPSEVRQPLPGKHQMIDRLKQITNKLATMDVLWSSFKHRGATIEISTYPMVLMKSVETPEEPEIVENPELPQAENLQDNDNQEPVAQRQKLELEDIAPEKPQPMAAESAESAVPQVNPSVPKDQSSKILIEINDQNSVPQKQQLAMEDIPPAKPQPLANGPAEFAVIKKEFKYIVKPEPLQSVNMIGREVAYKYPHPCEHNPDLYVIGPNGSTIAKSAWESINWEHTPAVITRKILMCLFDKYTLATHNLSGRPSPAFKGIYKAEKMPLHAGKVADTVSIVTTHVNVTAKEVRMAITTKCADECKMLRLRQEKKSKINKEFLEKLAAQQV